MNSRELLAERVRFLYAGSPISLAVGGVAGVLLVTVHWMVVPRGWLLGWLLTLGVVLAGRTVLVSCYRRATASSQARDGFWLRRFRVASLAGGLCWGLGCVMLCQSGDPVYQAFVAFTMAGVSAGAVTSLAIDRTATLAFVIPLLAPLSIQFLLAGDRRIWIMGLIVLLFLSFLAVTAARIEGYLRDNVRLRLQAESQHRLIQTNEERLGFALESTGQGLWDWDIESGQVFYSQPWKTILGYGEDEIGTDINDWKSRLHPADRAAVEGALKRYLDGETAISEAEQRLRCRDGSYKWVLGRGQLIERTADGQPKRMIGVHIDIADLKRTETELRIAATVFEAQEGVIITDADEVILRVNRAFTTITGYTSEEVVGRTPRMLKSGRHDRDFYVSMWSSIERAGAWQGEIWNRRKNGETYPERLSITALKRPDGLVTNYVATLHDITERKAAEQAVRHLAFYDALTLLPNRRLLLDRLDHALNLSERSGRFGALLFIDLDHFKQLNDTLGHAVGDLLLQEVAQRLRKCVRDVDTVARLGGDEFVVMLEHLSGDMLAAEGHARHLATKILATLVEPYELSEHRHHSTPSIGLIMFFGRQAPPEELLERADLAMYHAKHSGRNAVRLFDSTMVTSAQARLALKNDLRQGITHGHFFLHYQPQVDGAGRLIGAEALLRWANPRVGMVPPNTFIPMAEESGLILPLGQWVLESACTQLTTWSMQPLWDKLTLSINVSDRQFRDSRFVESLLAVLEKTGANPHRLKLELKAIGAGEGSEPIIAHMQALGALGVRFSLDNFGKNFSAVADLKHLPLHQLKLDQSFIRDLLTDPKAAGIAKSLIDLGNALGLEVVTVGVETEAQRQFLLAQSCQVFQGYIFGQPVSVEELTCWRLPEHVDGMIC